MKCNVNAASVQPTARGLSVFDTSRGMLLQFAALETNRNEREKQNLPTGHEKRERRVQSLRERRCGSESSLESVTGERVCI